MVYYPVFGPSQDSYIQNIIAPQKDVEGMCHSNRFNLYHNIRVQPENGLKAILPCTPLAVLKIMEHVGAYNTILKEGNRLYGKNIVIINTSEVCLYIYIYVCLYVCLCVCMNTIYCSPN